jgi:hypothetical protein
MPIARHAQKPFLVTIRQNPSAATQNQQIIGGISQSAGLSSIGFAMTVKLAAIGPD